MKLFYNNAKQLTRESHVNRYKSARTDLLIIIIFTVLNIALFLFKSDTIMLFSASVPYIAVVIGFLFSGGAIDDIYIEFGTETGITVAFVILALYFACWLKSKKNHKWLTVAALLFITDTIVTLIIYHGKHFENIIDIIVHFIAAYFLCFGAESGRILQKMSAEPIKADGSAEYADGTITENTQTNHSVPLRYADDDRVNSKHLCTAEYMGLNIVYRRVKNINELVVNGYVYDEIKMTFEKNHKLYCTVNGFKIEVGYTSVPSRSYIKVNGETIKTKVRI